MSNQFSTGDKNKQPDRDISLSDLIPDLLAPPPAALPDRKGRQPLPPTESNELEPVKRAGLGEYKLIIGAFLGLFLFPLFVIGIVLLIVNGQSGPTPEQLAQNAATPQPTIFSITPLPSGKAGPTGKPGTNGSNNSPVATTAAGVATLPPCNPGLAFAGIDGYSCVRTVGATSSWDSFFAQAEPQLNQNGIRIAGNQRRYDVTRDDPGRVLGFYSGLLLSKGFNLARPVSSGTTSIGNYRVDQYARGTQQWQILALTLNRDSPDKAARSGETVIRYSAS